MAKLAFEIGRLSRTLADRIQVSGLAFRNKPAPADTKHGLYGQSLRRLVLRDTPGRTEFYPAKDSAEGLQCGQPAGGLGREEFEP